MTSRSYGGNDTTTLSNKGSGGWVLIGNDDEDSKSSDDSWVLEGCGVSKTEKCTDHVYNGSIDGYETEMDISPPTADLRIAPNKSDDDIDETKSDASSRSAQQVTAPDSTDHNYAKQTETSTCDGLHDNLSDGGCAETPLLKSLGAGALPCHMQQMAQLNVQEHVEQAANTPQAKDELSSYGILKYEAPLQKPLPPGIAMDTDITGPGSICSMICHEEYLQNLGDDKKCYLCRGHLCCQDELPVSLKACDHKFHLGCLRQGLQRTLPNCPKCQKYLLSDEDSLLYLRGNQPSSSMSWKRDSTLTCAGHDGCGSIIITYQFPSPVWRQSTDFLAYLPDNLQGQQLFFRLQAAFLCGLTFNVNVHRRFNKITWGNIPHKAYRQGGIECRGFPDENYLDNCNTALTKMSVPPYAVCKEFYDPLNLVGTDCADLSDAPNDNWITSLEHIKACDISSIREIKVEKEMRSEEMIIQYLIQGEYVAASDIYNAACDASGMPPLSWAQEVGRYIRYHIRDEDEIKAHFPNLPRSIYISTEDE